MDIAPDVTRKRRPRFTRVNTSELPLALTERDFYGLKWLYERRLMTSELLCHVLPGSDQRKLRRFQKWYHHGLIERLWTGIFNEPFVLGITDRGADLVCARYGLPRGNIGWNKKNSTLHDYLFREHTLGVSRFCVAIDRGIRHLRKMQAQDEFSRWSPEQRDAAIFEELGHLKRCYAHAVTWRNEQWADRAHAKVLEDLALTITPRVQLAPESQRLEDQLWYRDQAGEQRKVEPDWPFSIINGKDVLDCALEWDRSTVRLETTTGQRDMLARFRAYWSYYKEQRERARQGLAAHNKLRVLTVAKSEERAEHLSQVARRADEKQTGSSMFWFTTVRQLSLADPSCIQAPIWQTARDDKLHRLLELGGIGLPAVSLR
jgi:hypothetical protein